MVTVSHHSVFIEIVHIQVGQQFGVVKPYRFIHIFDDFLLGKRTVPDSDLVESSTEYVISGPCVIGITLSEREFTCAFVHSGDCSCIMCLHTVEVQIDPVGSDDRCDMEPFPEIIFGDSVVGVPCQCLAPDEAQFSVGQLKRRYSGGIAERHKLMGSG